MTTNVGRESRAKGVGRWALVLTMVGIGVLHFVVDDLFAQMVPPFLPWPYGLVWVSGVVEILLGLGLVPEPTRRLSGIGLVALYVAVFPANIYMAVSNLQMHGLPSWIAQPSPAALWMRLPLQAGFIVWALWVSGWIKKKVV
jgi:uncharacterized membrane protein